MKKFLNFLSYHNAVPIALSIVLLGAGGTYAATNPEAILSATSTVQSIDNTFIVNTDLSQWDYKVQIMGVTQDENMYYVAYQYETLQLQNDVWQKVLAVGQMKASKKETDQSGVDLGIFVAKELAQIIEHEKKLLLAAQDIEKKKGESQRTVATTYSGLVGKFLDDTEETFPGYVPVVDPRTDEDELAAANAAAAAQAADIERTMNVALANVPTADQITSMVDAQVKKLLAGTVASPTPDTPSSDSSGGPTLAVNGANPARLHVGDVYSDLGAAVEGSGPEGNLTVHTFVDGEEMGVVLINTSAPGSHTIVYRATDGQGRTGETSRTVIVEAAESVEPPVEEPPVETPPTETPPATTTPPVETPPAETPPVETPPTDTPTP